MKERSALLVFRGQVVACCVRIVENQSNHVCWASVA